MVAAIQGAFAKQVPLYAKTKELSKWIKMPSFNIIMDHSAEWKKRLDTEMMANAQALGMPLKRVQSAVKVFDKNGADVTAHLFSAEVQQFPEDVFPLSIQFTKALLPNKEDLLEPLLCLAESSKEKTDHACERLAEASNNLIPDIVNCPRKFAIFFVVPPLVVLLIVNVVSVVMSPFAADAAETALDDTERTAKELKESGAVLVSMVVQLSLAVVASLDSTQKRVHKAFHKRIMSRVCDKFQREVDEIMGVLKSGLDQAVKAFWTALHKVLSLVKIILQLKAAAGRLRGVADALPDRGRIILQNVRETGGNAASEALKRCAELTEKGHGLGQSTIAELQGIGSKSLTAAEEQMEVLAHVAETTKLDIKQAASMIAEKAKEEPQVLLDAVISAGKDAVKEVLQVARAMPHALEDEIASVIADGRAEIADLVKDAVEASKEVAAAMEDKVGDGGQAAVESLAEAAAEKADNLRHSLEKAEDAIDARLDGLGAKAREQAKSLRAALVQAAVGLRQKITLAKEQLVSVIEIAEEETTDATETTAAAVATALSASAGSVVDAMRSAAKGALCSAEAEFESILKEVQGGLSSIQKGIEDTVKKGRTDVEDMLAQVANQVGSATSVVEADIEGIDTTSLKTVVEAAHRAQAAVRKVCGDALETVETELKGRTSESLSKMIGRTEVIQHGLHSKMDVVTKQLDKLEVVGSAARGLEDEVKVLVAIADEPLAKAKVAVEALGAALRDDPFESVRSECNPCSEALDKLATSVTEARERFQDTCDDADEEINKLSKMAARILGTSRAIGASKMAVRQLEEDSKTASDATMREADKQIEGVVSQRGGIMNRSNNLVCQSKIALQTIAEQGISDAEKQSVILTTVVKEAVEDALQPLAASCVAKTAASPEVARTIMLQFREDIGRAHLRAQEIVPQLNAQMSEATKKASAEMLALASDAAKSVEKIKAKACTASSGDTTAILEMADAVDKQADELEETARKAVDAARRAVTDIGSQGKKQADVLNGLLNAASDGLKHKLQASQSELDGIIVATEGEANKAITAARGKVAEAVQEADKDAVEQMKISTRKQVDSVLEALGCVVDEVRALVEAGRVSVKEVIGKGQKQMAKIATRAAKKKKEITRMLADAFNDDDSAKNKAAKDPEVVEALSAFDGVAAKASELSGAMARKIDEAEAAFASAIDVSTNVEEFNNELKNSLNQALAGVAKLSGLNQCAKGSQEKIRSAMAKVTEATAAVRDAVEAFPTDMDETSKHALAESGKKISELAALVEQSVEVREHVGDSRYKVDDAIDDLHGAATAAREAIETIEHSQQVLHVAGRIFRALSRLTLGRG
eukprot:TRINITY_DN13864_c0_g1_i6.p1 TRINITY_DN13864_c0_g1~~TRINITY_DN13864_c0_g1_i6.p1  ORF type:complete len:1546 (+),score=371.08 TRINITY_DN13864_c0_g1_i6:623-4639(+)